MMTLAVRDRETQWHRDALALGAPTREAYERGENLAACDETSCFLLDMAIGMYKMTCWRCPICAANSRTWWLLAGTLPDLNYLALYDAIKLTGAMVPPLLLEAR